MVMKTITKLTTSDDFKAALIVTAGISAVCLVAGGASKINATIQAKREKRKLNKIEDQLRVCNTVLSKEKPNWMNEDYLVEIEFFYD